MSTATRSHDLMAYIERNRYFITKKLMDKVDLKTKDECWLWTGPRHGDGYGMIYTEGRSERTHRLSFALFNGPVENGKLVCHKCDNPPCVNPHHLFQGTAQDNVIDYFNKGRATITYGERSHNAKFTNREAERVRELGKTGMSHDAIAAIYGVNQTTISRIIRRIRYVKP